MNNVTINHNELRTPRGLRIAALCLAAASFITTKANPNSRVGFDQFPAEHIVIAPLQ